MTYKRNKTYSGIVNEAAESGTKLIKALRVKSSLYEKFLKALEKYNSENEIESDINHFHKMALSYFSNIVLASKFEIIQGTKKQ